MMAAQQNKCSEKCYGTTNKCPIIVKVHKEVNDGSGCGKPCYVHINGINRFPSITSKTPITREYAISCEECLEKIRERDFLLFEKEHEKLKIITDYITFPRTREETTGKYIKHDYKGLQEMENELLRKERELAMMKREACDDVCYNTLRQKQLELRWKDFELERQPRPSIFERTRKKIEKVREEHCFTALQKKERELLEKERAIDEEIEKFRERNYNEEMRKLKNELKWRKRPILEPPVDCSCDCAKYTKMMYKEIRRREKLTRDVYRYFPVGGYITHWSADTWEQLWGCTKKGPTVNCRYRR